MGSGRVGTSLVATSESCLLCKSLFSSAAFDFSNPLFKFSPKSFSLCASLASSASFAYNLSPSCGSACATNSQSLWLLRLSPSLRPLPPFACGTNSQISETCSIPSMHHRIHNRPNPLPADKKSDKKNQTLKPAGLLLLVVSPIGLLAPGCDYIRVTA